MKILKYKFQIMLAIFIISFIAVFSFLSVKRYNSLNSYYYDLGIMNQVVDNTSRGWILEMSNQQLLKNTNRMAIHFDPILAVFAPIYLIYRDPSVLLVSQAAIVGLGALAVYLIGVHILRRKSISLLFAASFLMYFQIQRVVLFDFHAVALATTFLLFAFYFNLVKKNFWYFLFLVLALLTKEHVGMVVALFGVYLYLFKKEKKTGLATVALGGLFFVASVYVIIPYFRNESHFALKYFETLGDSPSKVLVNVLIRPRYVFGMILGQDSINYVLRLITPAFYAVFSPFSLLVALPEWAINTISINGNMRSYYFHYSSLIVPVIFYSLILGFRNFENLVKNRLIKTVVLALFIAANIYSIHAYNPVPVNLVKHPVGYRDLDPVKKRSIEVLQEKLRDENIKLSTTPRLAPFFTNRRYYHNFLFDSAYAAMGQTEEDVIKSKLGSYKDSDYVIIDNEEIGDLSEGSLTVKFYVDMKDSEMFEVVATDDRTIEVYKKIDGKTSLIKHNDI